MTDIGPILRALRERAGLTLRDAARAAGLSHQAIWAWEAGVNDITLPKLEQLANALGVTVDLHVRPLDGAADNSSLTPAQAELINVLHRDIRNLSDSDVGILLSLLDRMRK